MKILKKQLTELMQNSKEFLNKPNYQEIIMAQHMVKNEGLPYEAANFLVEWIGKAESVKRLIRLLQEKNPEFRDVKWQDRQRKKVEYPEKYLKD